MIVNYVMIVIVALLGSLIAWDDLRPIDRKPQENDQ